MFSDPSRFLNARGEHKHVCERAGCDGVWVHVQLDPFKWVDNGHEIDTYSAEYARLHACPKCGKDQRIKAEFSTSELDACEAEVRGASLADELLLLLQVIDLMGGLDDDL
jgi:hypothetical protein